MNWLASIVKKIFVEQNTEWKESMLKFDQHMMPIMTRKIRGERVYREMTDKERKEYLDSAAW